VARFNHDDQVNWARQGGGQGADAGQAVAVTLNQSVIVAGYFEDEAYFEGREYNGHLEALGERDVFALRYNPEGVLTTFSAFGGHKEEQITAMALLNNRNSAVLSGFFSEEFGFNESVSVKSNSNGIDAFLVKFDLNNR
jgi:hypothetical protein